MNYFLISDQTTDSVFQYHAPVFDISGKTYFTLKPTPQGGNAGSFIHLVSMNLKTPVGHFSLLCTYTIPCFRCMVWIPV